MSIPKGLWRRFAEELDVYLTRGGMFNEKIRGCADMRLSYLGNRRQLQIQPLASIQGF